MHQAARLSDTNPDGADQMISDLRVRCAKDDRIATFVYRMHAVRCLVDACEGVLTVEIPGCVARPRVCPHQWAKQCTSMICNTLTSGLSSNNDVDNHRTDSCANLHRSGTCVACSWVYIMLCDTLTSCCSCNITNALIGIISYANVHMSRKCVTYSRVYYNMLYPY